MSEGWADEHDVIKPAGERATELVYEELSVLNVELKVRYDEYMSVDGA